MTATPYRADHGCIVSEEQAASFTTYSLDFLRHFNTLGINKVDMNLEEYKNKSDLFNRLADNLRKEIKTNKHFVFVPPTGKKWRAKKEDVYTLFDIIYTVVMQEYNVTFEVAKSMVLDLVTERTQRRNDKLLRQEPKSGQSHASKYAVVVACMKCREGSDWCPGDRLHNTSMEKSPPLNFQTNGRLFRQFPGKDNVKIYYYVKEFLTQNKTKREFVSDTVNAMLYYMLMDDLFNPIMVEIPHFAPKNKNEKVSKKKSKTTLADHFGLNYFEAKRVLLKSFEDCSLNDQNAERIISKVINKYLPNKDSYDKKHITEIKNAWKVFLIRVASKNMRDKSVDISYVRKNGFDTIVEKEGISGNIFTSHLTPAEMQRFRQISRLKKWDNETLDKEIEYLFKFAEKQLNRKLLNSRVVKDTKNPDKEALEIIKNEHENFKSFNDKVNDIAKQKEVFSVQEIASALAVSENELKARINRWKTFLPSNWKDDLLDKSWSCF
jgi:rubrerythrin